MDEEVISESGGGKRRKPLGEPALVRHFKPTAGRATIDVAASARFSVSGKRVEFVPNVT
ncbi:hypothetical protein [Caballeronia glebae]|uniref:hypothetical protein n=1 Tax=Caballeronia glebae TaxID=1777143 RepID=UPI00135C54C1|nr:hypothetical protein [Caballeronia glebae]